jgi:sRNA-binding carbon storage regulator CsrA
MQILTCRVGETVRIGNDLSVTLQSRSGDRVTVSVIAPPDADLIFDNVCLRPSVLPSAARSYLFSMLAVRRFRVGGIEIQVWLPGDAVSLAAEYDDYLHIGVRVPKACRITREQTPQSLGTIGSPTHAQSVRLF